MAYLNFSDVMTDAPATTAAMCGAADPFSPLEWTVVQLARRDGIGSLTATPRFARLRVALFGTRPDPRLADPKLEALRRVAVHAWRHGLAVPETEVTRFRDAGFGQRQLETVVRWIDARRG